MNHTELDQELREYSRSIEFAGKQRVLKQLSQSDRNERAASAKIGRRTALIFAVVMALVVATVFADDLANIIREFTLNRFTATQQETLIAHDGESITSSIMFLPDESVEIIREDADAIMQWEFFHVEDTDELKRLLDFVRMPETLPEGYVFDYATLTRYPSGKLAKDIEIYYQKAADLSIIRIDEYYVGENGTIDLKTVETIEHIKIGSADALLVSSDFGGSEILWIQDGTAYRVYAPEVEIARMIAESFQ